MKSLIPFILCATFFIAGNGCDFSSGGGGNNEAETAGASNEAMRIGGLAELRVRNNGPSLVQVFIDGVPSGTVPAGDGRALIVTPAGQQEISVVRITDKVQVVRQSVNLPPNTFFTVDILVNGQTNISSGPL